MRVSLREVARQVGVSAATVSKVMNNTARAYISGARRDQIFAAARASRYRPNDDIAIVSPGGAGATAITARFFAGFQAAAQEHDIRLVTEQTRVTGVPDCIERWRVGGAVFFDAISAATLAALKERGIPYVLANPAEDRPRDCVIVDDYAGVRDALELMELRGLKRAALMLPRITHASFPKRLKAYRDFCKARRIKRACAHSHDFYAALDELGGVLSTRSRLGVVTVGEWGLALEAHLRACTGRDDHLVVPVAEWSSPWTHPRAHVRLPLRAVAKAALEMIRSKWESGNAHAASVTVRPELIEESTT